MTNPNDGLLPMTTLVSWLAVAIAIGLAIWIVVSFFWGGRDE